MTTAEQKRFERLATAIRRISSYSTPRQLRREYGGGDSGIDYVEALEYAYENMRNEARAVVGLVRPKRATQATTAARTERAIPEGLCTACSATQYCAEHDPTVPRTD